MKKIYNIILSIILIVSLVNCKGFLDEENRESLTDAVIFNNPQSFDQLVANVYDRMRIATTFYDLDHLGTDIFTRGEVVGGINELNDYVNLRPVNGALITFWRNYYQIISSANIAIDRTNEIVGLTDAQRNRGIAEVKFFRAFSYFQLVEHFGGVPLVLNEIRSAQSVFHKSTEEEVYAQILQDLADALVGVEESPSQFGRVSKDAARHLTAKVLLTRGYKAFGSSQDFSEAAGLAETVVMNKPLVNSFSSLHSRENQQNSEVIFSLLYGSNPVSRGVGNNRHLLFKFSYDVYPGQTRSILYHRGLGPAPTPFFYTLFEDGDERETATIRRVLIAEVNNANYQIQVGDTSLYFPKTPWSQAVRDSKNYPVVNPGEYYIPNGITQVHYPMFRKFDDPGVPYTNPGINPDGERDAVIMRSGETRLIAAEAFLNLGNLDKAAEHLQALRTRAGLVSPVNMDALNVDYILNESAKELAGEVSRWMDLKRTGKLLERVLEYNPHAALNRAMIPIHLLRPIPQSEVDVSGGTISQNPGY